MLYFLDKIAQSKFFHFLLNTQNKHIFFQIWLGAHFQFKRNLFETFELLHKCIIPLAFFSKSLCCRDFLLNAFDDFKLKAKKNTCDLIITIIFCLDFSFQSFLRTKANNVDLDEHIKNIKGINAYLVVLYHSKNNYLQYYHLQFPVFTLIISNRLHQFKSGNCCCLIIL